MSINIIQEIEQNIYTNATQAITGQKLQTTLKDMVQGLSAEGVYAQTFDYSHFGGHESAMAAITLATPLQMTAPGDYIEVKVKANSNAYILRQPTANNQLCVRYYTQNTLQVRFNSTTNWTNQNNDIDWSKVQTLKIALGSVSGTTYNYTIYLNGVQLGTQAVTGATLWSEIAWGGNNVNMDIYYIEAKMGGVVTKLTQFAQMQGAVAVTDIYTSSSVPSLAELDERVGSLESEMAEVQEASIGEDMYFRFHKTSTLYNIQSHFGVYQRIKGNYYLLTVLGYYVYNGSAGYPNGYWRVERTDIGTLIDGEWTSVQQQVLTAGENEFVLQWLDGSGYNFAGGFAGGYHWGETIDNVAGAWVEFVANGNRLSTDMDIPITPCKSFYYREYSPIYQHNDNTIAAWHLKETIFKDGGYETMNDVKFVQALDYFAYPGIVCVSRWLSEKAMPEGVATITDMGDGSTTIPEQFKSNGHSIHYEGNGYACDVTSEVRFGADDTQCQRVVYNSSAYNKFYRRNPDTAGSTDNRLVGVTKVKIKKIG